ncbi:hypothetical protein A2318_00485 [Candidatus Uhrbacteria bacterium RIFOXYB2_FULL_45_11]|uniref:Uncharacterized protein n=1 Tax=Candidatus Uhrbacteria bacterium RIFOXYB2_FULL_45_11 TaxID=1802421 RepID=A0A1F7W7B9_9BACT|nr:MAG: hypothetical protein A2318_00485 [Candidatus Uhrbacteria bacterium RIFOXYB2_FULL_45_11]
MENLTCPIFSVKKASTLFSCAARNDWALEVLVANRFKAFVFGLAIFFTAGCSSDQMVEARDGEAASDSLVSDASQLGETSEEIHETSSVDVFDAASETTVDVFKCTDHASCDTKNPCTQDWCNVGTGECQHTPQPDSICTDGDACTVNDLCTKSGQCVGAKQVVCNDNSPCTKDFCEKLSGCDYEPIDAACTDNDVCTKNDTCMVGVCIGTKIICNDGIDCTEDSCDKNTGCSTVKQNNLPCDDGSECTVNDLCDKGVCKGSNINCSDTNPCTQDACDKVSGCFSTSASSGSKCTDGNACTMNDTCQDSKCVSGAQKNCDDSSLCTSDSCDSANGSCLNVAVVGVYYCNDGSACTTNDSCTLGVCTGKILQCSDGLDCTQDSCGANTGCVFMVQDKSPCNDGDACTVGDICLTSKCEGKVKTCEDNNDCTIDTCDSAIGSCNFTANDGYYCSDANACTAGDVCTGTKCTGTTMSCNDGNVCTSDSCNKKTGCVFIATPNAPCDDGDLCSTDEICQQSVCKAKPVVCNDDNTCTKDSCNKATGKCVFQSLNDTNKCDDGDLCTIADICLSSQCKGTVNTCDDNVPCTVDACIPKDGKCDHIKMNCP